MQGPIATIGSLHICPLYDGPKPHVGGPVVVSGAPGVLVNGKAIALMGDMCTCASAPDMIAQGSSGVTVNGIPVATVNCLTAHGGIIAQGEIGVIITSSTPNPIATLPKHKIPFPEISFKNRVLTSISGKSNAEAITNQATLKAVAPIVLIPEDSTTVTFKTTFAQDQLHLVAKKASLALFMRVFIKIYGLDIPAIAFDELYQDAKNKAALVMEPTLKVKTSLPYGGGYAAFYNDGEINEIWVAEQAIRNAETDNKVRGELMTALVEEYGHYLDYILRHKYALTENKDAQRDEGAKFDYKLYNINPIEQAEQHFADATIDGRTSKMIWEFNELHNNLQQYVNEERQDQEDKKDNYEFYKAGYLKPHGEHHTAGEGSYGHGDIEQEALQSRIRELSISDIIASKDIEKTLHLIYLGNWLRDFSQAVDPMIVRPMSNAADALGQASGDYFRNEDTSLGKALGDKVDLDALKNNTLSENHVTAYTMPTGLDWGIFPPKLKFKLKDDKFYPVKLSVNALTSVVKLAAVKEFIHGPEGNNPYEKDIENYKGYVATLKEEYIDITPETLGVYRPEEHIDNPKGVGQTETGGDRYDKDLYGKFVGYVADNNEVHSINDAYGMKNYIRSDRNDFTVNGAAYETSFSYIKRMLSEAANGAIDNPKSLIALGAALHTLEDYFAHSNYSEIALIKSVEPLVFPWVDTNEKGFFYNYNDIRNRKKLQPQQRLIDRKRVRSGYDTNELASYLPLVTGTFGLVDTAASIMPILNEHFFNIEYTPWKETKHVTRTFGDMMLLEWMGAFDESQAEDGTGTNDDTYVNTLEGLLTVRDYMKYSEYLIPDKVEEGFHWLMEHIGSMFKFTQHFVLNASASTLNDAQVLIDKDLKLMNAGTFAIGTDPSHTQLAKDDPGHPLHNLSAQLAVEAVKQVGEKMIDVWTRGAKVTEVMEIVDKIMRHPVESIWQEKIVIAWAKEHPDLVCKACSPSILVDRTLHAIEEVDEALKGMRVNLLDAQITEKIAEYIEKKTGEDVDEKGLVDFIDEAILVSQQQTEKIVGNKEKGVVGIKEIWDKKYPKPANCRIKQPSHTYTVKRNDTLSGIAAKGNTTIADLLELNPTLEKDLIFSGRIIMVPHPIIEMNTPFKD